MAEHTDNSVYSMHYCRRCLTGYQMKESLKKHDKLCSKHEAVRIDLPEADTMLYQIEENAIYSVC